MLKRPSEEGENKEDIVLNRLIEKNKGKWIL